METTIRLLCKALSTVTQTIIPVYVYESKKRKETVSLTNTQNRLSLNSVLSVTELKRLVGGRGEGYTVTNKTAIKSKTRQAVVPK